jgi:hypothetical protein
MSILEFKGSSIMLPFHSLFICQFFQFIDLFVKLKGLLSISCLHVTRHLIAHLLDLVMLILNHSIDLSIKIIDFLHIGINVFWLIVFQMNVFLLHRLSHALKNEVRHLNIIVRRNPKRLISPHLPTMKVLILHVAPH